MYKGKILVKKKEINYGSKSWCNYFKSDIA